MLLMNLSAGREWRCRCRKQTWGHKVGKRRVGWTGRAALTHMHYQVWNRQLAGGCWVAQGAQVRALWWPRGWDRPGGSKAHEWGGSCIHIADSLCCTAEMNRILQSNYTPIFFKKKKTSLTHLTSRKGRKRKLREVTWPAQGPTNGSRSRLNVSRSRTRFPDHSLVIIFTHYFFSAVLLLERTENTANICPCFIFITHSALVKQVRVSKFILWFPPPLLKALINIFFFLFQST